MLTLILETSTEKGLIALADKAEVLASRPLPGGPELSRTLALEVKNLLNGLKPDLIATGTGPGSYTGIRVAAALAKALAYGWNIPLIGFCSLEAFGPAPVLIDARSGGFYALLDQEPTLLSPTDPRLHALPLIRSPHPALIQKRLSAPEFLEMEPSPKRLASLVWSQFLEEGAEPFALNYVSHP